MKSLNIMIFALCFIIVSSLTAQDFRVEPDSLSGNGIPDDMNKFDSEITNLWDQENVILWESEADLPDGWFVEFCQVTRNCWPSWITSDTVILPPNGTDVLEVKFYTTDTEGTGIYRLSLTPDANNELRQEFTFELTVESGGISGGNENDGNSSGLSFNLVRQQFGGTVWEINLPHSTDEAFIDYFDMQGRRMLHYPLGRLASGKQEISKPQSLNLPDGIYFVKLSVPHLGSVARKWIQLR